MLNSTNLQAARLEYISTWHVNKNAVRSLFGRVAYANPCLPLTAAFPPPSLKDCFQGEHE